MLSVLLIWTYIAVTAGIIGKGILALFGYRPRRFSSVWLAGLTCCTVYAEAWSLVAGVGLAANVILLLICAVIFTVLRRDIIEGARKAAVRLLEHHGLLLICLAAAILFLASGTSAGNWHRDTPLYHAQSIHWIETYGAIRGLGNLQSHFAYNNACFPLYALFSFHFLPSGQSFHAVQGFLAMLLFAMCIPIDTSLHRTSDIRPSVFLRLAAIAQIALLYDELVSPSSDCFVLILIHAVVLLWTEVDEDDEINGSPIPYALLAMLAVYAVTIKLAAAPMLFFCIKPVRMLLSGKNRDLGTFFRFVLTAVLITLPFFIRNIILSGWVLYPVLPLHFPELPWRIPDGVGAYESFEIRENGRMIFDMSHPDASMFGWVGAWFVREQKAARLLLCAALVGLLPVASNTVSLTVEHFGSGNHASGNGSSAGAERVYVETVLTACLLFWFFTTPQMRFGEGYLLVFLATVYGNLFCDMLRVLPDRVALLTGRLSQGAFVIVFVGCMAIALKGRGMTGVSHLLAQQDYDTYAVDTYDIDGIEFYYPTDYVYTGYYAFPATRWKDTGIYALGDDIRDGFSAAVGGE